MSMGIFTLSLGANESREAAISGEYFELRNALFPVVLIELLDRSGGVIARLDNPEQSDFVRPGRYETIRITNGATAQTIKHFYGSGDAGSRRTSGLVTIDGASDVSVIDGGKSRTLAGGAFLWTVIKSVGAGVLPVAQLWNPAGSGKNLIVTRGCVSATVAGGVYMGVNTAALGVAAGYVGNKKSMSANTSVASPLSSSPAAMVALTKNFGFMFLQNYGQWQLSLNEPIVIEPGSGLIVQHDTTTGLAIGGQFEYFEEPI